MKNFSPSRLIQFLLATFLFNFASNAQVQSFQLTPLWSIAPETSGYEWMSTNNTQRGLALNPATSHLLTVTRFPVTNASVYILSSDDGAVLGNLSTNGIFGEINFPLNLISAADDGVIYACNLTVDSTNTAIGNTGPFRIYRWANESADPTVAYIGDPSNDDTNANHRRFGDSFVVRGSGVDTEILAGTRAGKIVARFTTSDGVNFVHQKIDAPELVGAVAMATISFGANNTFFVKSESNVNTNYPLQQFSYDIGAGTATLLQNFTNPVVGGPLAFDVNRNLMGIIRTVSHDLRLFKLTSNGLVQQGTIQPFETTNANGNFTGAIVFAPDKLFALESNNGLMAFAISTNALPPFAATVTADSTTATLTWPGAEGFLYQPQFKDALSDPNWTNLGNPTNGTGELSISDTVEGAMKFYRVQAE